MGSGGLCRQKTRILRHHRAHGAHKEAKEKEDDDDEEDEDRDDRRGAELAARRREEASTEDSRGEARGEASPSSPPAAACAPAAEVAVDAPLAPRPAAPGLEAAAAAGSGRSRVSMSAKLFDCCFKAYPPGRRSGVSER